MREQLNQLDLAFVVDTTGSMGAFIQAARGHMTALLRTLTADAAFSVDLHVGLVEYRDHPPQDRTFVTRAYPFTPDLKVVQRAIDRFKPDGGGDTPEAVYDGLRAASDSLAWRPHSRRIAVLVGDAPPHGWPPRDGQPQPTCACGLTVDATTAIVEGTNITLYALGLTAMVDASFGRLARATGGTYFAAYRGEDAIPVLEKILVQEFSDLDFDGQVLDRWLQHPTGMADELALALASTPGRVAASLDRLGRRGLLRHEEAVVLEKVSG